HTRLQGDWSSDVCSSDLEIVAVVGGSGCGKSTLLRAVSGLDRPTQGSVKLDGDTILEPHQKIGVIFQEPRLLPWLTVADNVGFRSEERRVGQGRRWWWWG